MITNNKNLDLITLTCLHAWLRLKHDNASMELALNQYYEVEFEEYKIKRLKELN